LSVLERADGVLRQSARDPGGEEVVDVRDAPVPEEALPRPRPVGLADVEVRDRAARALVDPAVDGPARLACEEVGLEGDPVSRLDRDGAEAGGENQRREQEEATGPEGEREEEGDA